MSGSLDVLNTANISQLLAQAGTGIGGSVSLPGNVTGIGSTQTTIMTTPTILWKNNRAYQVSVWGLATNTTNSPSYMLFELIKGTGTGGSVWKGQIRVQLLSVVSSTVNTAINFSTVLLNTTGADFSSTMTLGGAVNVGTAQFSASAASVAYVSVADCGSAANWPGQPIS